MVDELVKHTRMLETGLGVAAQDASLGRWERFKLLLALRQVQKARRNLGELQNGSKRHTKTCGTHIPVS